MTLAFQCGAADIEQFEDSLSKSTMDRWEHWFTQRPQGMHHLCTFLAQVAASICASNGLECDPDKFIWWGHKPEKVMSQGEIDHNVLLMKAQQEYDRKRKEPKECPVPAT